MRSYSQERALEYAARSGVSTRRPATKTKTKCAWSYDSDAYSRSHVKQAQREKVLEFFSSNLLHREKHVKVLSLPGATWSFERQLKLNIPDKIWWFIGLERDFSVMARNKCNVPGALYSISTKTKEIGRASFDMMRSRYARWVNMSFDDFLNFPDLFLDDLKDVSYWKARYFSSDGAWLDFTGPITGTFIENMPKIANIFNIQNKSSPLAMTFMYGRDSGVYGGIDGRVALFESKIPGFTVKDAWTYNGMNDCKMFTVMGIVKRKKADELKLEYELNNKGVL